jgi:3-dehydroquinate synthase II
LKETLFTKGAQLVDTLLVDRVDVDRAHEAGVPVAADSTDADISLLRAFDVRALEELKRTPRLVAVELVITKGEDEETVARAIDLSADYIILRCPDWKIIPLENTIAKTRGRSLLFTRVRSAEEAKVALQTLELGADGIVLKSSDLAELRKTASLLKNVVPRMKLASVEVVGVKPIETGARVCIDTCDLMEPGEGILCGCQSHGLFLVEAEVHRNQFVETRPFRVNAGTVALYTLTSLNRTRYLSELKAGEEILIVNRQGRTRPANVGRVKIEWRPMMLVEAKHNGMTMNTIVQNAETIRFVTEEGSKSVTELKKGDEVLAHISEGGRHFGMLVQKEKVIER